MRVFIFSVIFFVAVSLGQAEQTPYHNHQLGLKTVFPEANWVLFDRSVEDVKVLIYAPPDALLPRFAIITLPKSNMPEGMASRSQQIAQNAGPLYEQVSLSTTELGGRAAERLVYVLGGSRVIEYGVARANYYMVLQVAAPTSHWQDTHRAQPLYDIFSQLEWLQTEGEASVFDTTSPQEIRAKLQQQNSFFEILSHDVKVFLEPQREYLEVEDTFTIQANSNEVSSLLLYFSLSDITELVSLNKNYKISWRWEKSREQATGNILLDVTPSLHKGQTLPLHVKAYTENIFSTSTESLANEFVWGRIAEESSFLSQMFYYPVDSQNTAAVNLEVSIPKGYQAVGGGRKVKEQTRAQRVIYSYYGRPQAKCFVPFGLAVGKYTKLEGKTTQGSLVELHLLDKSLEKSQSLDFLVKSASLFEELMGPLPFQRIALAQVAAPRKDILASSLGLILFSDEYGQLKEFLEEKSEKHNMELKNRSYQLLRELAYQWTLYHLPCSEQLSQGISNYVNLLFLEKCFDQSFYQEGIDFCRKKYIQDIQGNQDFAIAHPGLYKSNAYQSIISFKIPVIFDALRKRIGEEDFFKGWKKFFAMEGKQELTFYQQMEKVFSEISQHDLSNFFEQSFFKAGYPKIKFTWQQDEHNLYITVKQVQQGPTFDIDGKVTIFFVNRSEPFEQKINIGRETPDLIIVTQNKVQDLQLEIQGVPLWQQVAE